MFGRRVAITTVPNKPSKNTNPDATAAPAESTPIDFVELAELAKRTIIGTAAGVGAVVVAVKVVKTVCNIAEFLIFKKL